MRSHEAITIPVTSTRWRPGTRHHMLGPGSAGSGSRWPDHARFTRGVSGYGRARRSETAQPPVCLKAVRAFISGLGRYGMSPSPSGYLVSEHVT
jgi:hypothetical protein